MNPELRPPVSYEAKANLTKMEGHKVRAVWTDGLGISNDEDPEDRKKGFRPAYRFKKGFNGDFCEFIGEMDLVTNKPAFKLIEYAEKTRKSMRKKS